MLRNRCNGGPGKTVPSKLGPGSWCAIVAAATIVAYSRSLTAPFHFDDYNVIVNNHFLRHPLTGTYFLFWARTRLVPYITFALNLRFGGTNPFGFHLFNLVVHLVTTSVFFHLCIALCRTPRLRDTALGKRPLLLAVPAAFIFACHPLQVQAVTYISQRMASMAAMFYLGSVLLYVRARNASEAAAGVDGKTSARAWPAYAGSAVSAVAAFLSKENSATLPFAILLSEYIFFGRTHARHALTRLLPFLILACLIPVGWLFLRAADTVPAAAAGGGLAGRLDQLATVVRNAGGASTTSPLHYFFTQCVVVPRYLRLVFLPWGLNLDPDIPLEHDLSPRVGTGLALLASLLIGGISMRRRHPLLSFGILWFFCTHSVESGFFPISDVMAEHRMYLPMPGVAISVGTLWAGAFMAWPKPSLAVATAAGSALMALTIIRNEVWRTPVSLWQDTVSKSPYKARPHVNLGVALHKEGRFDEAIAHYCEALKIEPDNRAAATDVELALEEKLENGDTDLELFVGKNGVAEAVPIHPCPPPGGRSGQKKRKVGAPTHPPSSR